MRKQWKLWKDVEGIFFARVPLVKFTDAELDVQGDLSWGSKGHVSLF